MTEGGHRRRTSRRGRLSGVPLDQFKAELLSLVCASVQQCAGLEDVKRTGFGHVSVNVRVKGWEIEVADVQVSHTSLKEDAAD